MGSNVPQKIPDRPERRSFQRVKLNVHGRLMLEDHNEHTCQVADMSPGSIALVTDTTATQGEKCIAYLDHIGRIEGYVTRLFQNGFALSLSVSARKKDKLAAQLTWLVNKHELNLSEDRRHERIAPRNPVSNLQLPDGSQHVCRIVDLSISGAAIELSKIPKLGTQVILGTMRGTVVRLDPEGCAIEFANVQYEATLEKKYDAA